LVHFLLDENFSWKLGVALQLLEYPIIQVEHIQGLGELDPGLDRWRVRRTTRSFDGAEPMSTFGSHKMTIPVRGISEWAY